MVLTELVVKMRSKIESLSSRDRQASAVDKMLNEMLPGTGADKEAADGFDAEESFCKVHKPRAASIR